LALRYRLLTPYFLLLNPQFYIHSSKFSIAVCIIPNLAGMFNEYRTFFRIKLATDFTDYADLLATKRHKMHKRRKKWLEMFNKILTFLKRFSHGLH